MSGARGVRSSRLRASDGLFRRFRRALGRLVARMGPDSPSRTAQDGVSAVSGVMTPAEGRQALSRRSESPDPLAVHVAEVMSVLAATAPADPRRPPADRLADAEVWLRTESWKQPDTHVCVILRAELDWLRAELLRLRTGGPVDRDNLRPGEGGHP